MTSWCLLPGLFLYFLACIFYFANTFRRTPKLEEAAHVMTVMGSVLQLAWLIYIPFVARFENVLGLASFGVVLLFLWLLWRYRWESLGLLFMPIAFILLLLSLHPSQNLSGTFVVRLGSHPSLLMLHIAAAGLSFLFMLGNFVLGLAFVLQERKFRLKTWNPSSFNFPPLVSNEKRAFLWMKIGFTLLTIVLITGSMWVSQRGITSLGEALHVFVALIAWAIYAIVLNGRWTGFEGRRMLLLSFLGFVSLTSLFLWK
ncbi:MAG: cytochrome c biogenesis protein CcsA [Deltaproteobacteria bacterium]|nr:cytochrome c biogenesis protein CcsA [Deltaproteobacteria bacterium]